MFDLWHDELSQEDEERLLDRAAHEIKKRKLEMPALLMLEMHKPLSFIGSQASIVFSPFIVPFVGFDGFNDFSRLFAKRENVEKLLERLEQKGTPMGDSED